MAYCIIVFIAVFAATRGRSLIPGGWQNVIEMVIEGLCSQFESNVGSKYRQVATVLLTLFLFIFTANQIGLLPTEHLTASPTNDVNTTLGLAIAGSLITHFYFIKCKGFGHWASHFFKPFPVFVVMNLLEEVSKPVTLVMLSIRRTFSQAKFCWKSCISSAMLVPMIWIAVSLFIGLVQAYIFTTLTSVYMKESID